MPEPGLSVKGIILAAGEGSRFGGSKLSESLGSGSVVGSTIRSLSSFCESITVVTGCHREAVAAAVSSFEDIDLVHNAEYKSGMFSSVLAGVHAQPAGSALLLIPGDIPLVRESACRAILEHAAVSNRICIPVYKGKKGHPVFIPAAVVDRLRVADPAGNLRDFLEAEGFDRVAVNDPGVLRDIDTREDLRGMIFRGDQTRI